MNSVDESMPHLEEVCLRVFRHSEAYQLLSETWGSGKVTTHQKGEKEVDDYGALITGMLPQEVILLSAPTDVPGVQNQIDCIFDRLKAKREIFSTFSGRMDLRITVASVYAHRTYFAFSAAQLLLAAELQISIHSTFWSPIGQAR